MALSTAMFLTSNSVGAYLPTYLLKTQHLPLGTASQIVLIGYLCTLLAHLATGALADRVRRKYATGGTMAPSQGSCRATSVAISSRWSRSVRSDTRR